MLTISDSIALKILSESCLIAGVGNEVRVYTKEGGYDVPFQLKGKVHGIEYEEHSNLILIFGEYEFILVKRIQSSFLLLCRGSLSDWISSGKVFTDKNTFVLITAHSVALLLKYDGVRGNCEIETKSSCVDKSTLYCSYVCGSTWVDSFVIGGNAFGEVLIWQPSEKRNIDPGKAILFHRIHGHKGVVFSIDVDLEARLMVTTSDDRSIRFWDINLIETSDGRVDFKKSTFTPKKSGYGHTARVFKGKIVHEGSETYAITGGEDSYICLWNRNSELLFKRRQQFGATIWGLDYHSPTKTLFTTGSSGNITKYSLQNHFSQQHEGLTHVVPSEILDSHEYIAKIRFLHADRLIGITNKNRLMHRTSLLSGDWTVVEGFPSYKCTVLEVFNGFIAIAGYRHVTIYRYSDKSVSLSQIHHGEMMPGVIRSLIFLSADEFLVCNEIGNCKLSKLSNLNDSLVVNLPHCKEQWITTGCRVNHEFLVVSNRQGSLLLFAFASDSKSVILCDTVKRLHGHLGATTVSVIKDTPAYAILKTTGHDSTIRTIKLDKSELSLKVISRELIPIAWVERRALCVENNNELLFGFNDNHFVLWSRENDVHFQISCGGGHRCWDLQLELPKNQASMVFIKKKQVFLHQEAVFNRSAIILHIPRNKWHMKPCNIVEVIQSGKKIYLVSGGDDNLLKISFFCPITGKLKELFEIHSHISNIRALRKWRISSERYLLFSAGGRAQICVSMFDEKSGMIEELVDYTIQKEIPSNDVRFDPETRIMSIDVRHTGDDWFEVFAGCSDGYLRKFTMNKAFDLDLVQEVYYGRCILQTRVVGDFVLTTSTDGLITFWRLDLSTTNFKVAHHESGVNSFDVRLDDKGEIHLLTGGDDQQVVYSNILSNGGDFKIKNKHKMDYLHSAQVTAVCFSPCMRAFYTSSVDQMIRRVEMDTFKANWQRFSCVADVKGINVIQSLATSELMAFVYGCGLQAINLPKTKVP